MMIRNNRERAPPARLQNAPKSVKMGNYWGMKNVNY